MGPGANSRPELVAHQASRYSCLAGRHYRECCQVRQERSESRRNCFSRGRQCGKSRDGRSRRGEEQNPKETIEFVCIAFFFFPQLIAAARDVSGCFGRSPRSSWRSGFTAMRDFLWEISSVLSVVFTFAASSFMPER